MAITPDNILRPGHDIEPAGATSPANLNALLDGLGANVDPDRAAAVQATINRVTAKAKLSPASAQTYEKKLRAMASDVADSELLGPNAWDGHTLPIPWDVVAVNLAEQRTDQTITRNTAQLTVCAVVWVNRHGRFPDQLPSEAQDTTEWPTVDSVPVIAELLAGWDVDLLRWQCQALVIDPEAPGSGAGSGARGGRQLCRANTSDGRCQGITLAVNGLCRRHRSQPAVHPFEAAVGRRRCSNNTVRADQLCVIHAKWQMCRARGSDGERCGWPTAKPNGLCRYHLDAGGEFGYEPGPTDPTPIQIEPTHKATPLRAHNLEALARTDPEHQQRSEIVHAAALLQAENVPIGALAKLDRDDFRFDDFGQVTFEISARGGRGGTDPIPPSRCIAALRAYQADTGQRPTIPRYDAWREGRDWPSHNTIGQRFGKWSTAVAVACDGAEAPPDTQPQTRTFTLVGGHLDPRHDPVAAVRAVLDNPACADRPFSAVPARDLANAVHQVRKKGTDPRWRWRIETRDSALILVGWWWGIRAAELVSLRLDQFEADPDLEVLWLRYNPETSKTNRTDRVARRCTCDAEIIQPVKTEVVEGTDDTGWFRRTETVERRQRAQRPGLCPIRALCEWLACDWWLPPPTACGTDALIWLQTFLNSLDDDGKTRPAFPGIGTRADPTTPAWPAMVSNILRGRLHRCADLDWAQAHGLRRGQATEMRSAGGDWDDIMDDLGWKTETVARGYVDLDDPDRVSPGMTALLAVLTDDDVA